MNQAIYSLIAQLKQTQVVKECRNVCYGGEKRDGTVKVQENTKATKLGDIYDVLFWARKLITMKWAKCHLRTTGFLLRKTREESKTRKWEFMAGRL